LTLHRTESWLQSYLNLMINRLVIICLFSAFYTLNAQEADSTFIAPTDRDHVHSDAAKHNIKRATTLALIPGAGQIYNKKYWKAPLVWGAIGGVGYYYSSLDRDFTSYKQVLQLIIDQPTLTTRSDLESFDPELFASLPSPFYQTTANGVATETIGYMDALRTQREYAIFGLIGVYVLSILDANIDAHLYDFDVSDDLSLRPALIQTNTYAGSLLYPGLSLTYTLP